METTPLIGISACLLGHTVRFDGGHKYDAWLVETLGQYVDYVPVCPEVGCGLPVPREAMRLVGDPEHPLLLTVKTGIDITPRMLEFSLAKVDELGKLELCGFVFKSKSPSSGMERVKVYSPKGGPAQKKGVGIFAREFMRAYPLLPCEEEGRLHDPALRENFIERVFVTARWNELLRAKPKTADVIDFHTRHKLLLMAHNPRLYREMGKLVAEIKALPPDEFRQTYERMLAAAMASPATPARHQNVLQHILGYFKHDITPAEKAEVMELIDAYRAHQVPLIVPVTMLNHFARKYQKDYLLLQHYLHPHPRELALRNHV